MAKRVNEDVSGSEEELCCWTSLAGLRHVRIPHLRAGSEELLLRDHQQHFGHALQQGWPLHAGTGFHVAQAVGPEDGEQAPRGLLRPRAPEGKGRALLNLTCLFDWRTGNERRGP